MTNLVLPKLVDEIARTDPNAPWMSLPSSPDLKNGWYTLTFLDLANAVDGLAKWAEEKLGPGDGSQTIAYLGINDARYAASVVGLMKAGYKTLLPSLRNSREGQSALIEATSCQAVVHSEGVNAPVDTIKASKPGLACFSIPTFEELRQRGATTESYASRCKENEDAQVVILHTSGSTGLPKPIYLTHGWMAALHHLHTLPPPKGRITGMNVFLSSARMIVPAPFFHAMGMIVFLRSVFCKGPLVMLPPEKLPNAQLVLEVLQQTDPKVGIFPPSILEQISASDEGLAALGKLDYVFFGGAPLAHESGELINRYTRIVSMIGSTEASLIANMLQEDKRDWEYFEWAPVAGAQLEDAGEGVYEMVLKPADRKYQAVFHGFPELPEWRTKDLYEPHPSKAGLWRYRGRKDDVLVLSNGEKFNPVGFEKSLESHHLVKGALVVGQGRFQAGLVVEPEWEALPANATPDSLLETLWPKIEEANAEAPAHGRVWRSKVAIAKKEKPFKRAPKGSIMRKMTVDLYSSEIEALYSGEASDEQLGKLQPKADMPQAKVFVRKALKLAGIPLPDDAPDDVDVFRYGADSLQVLAVSSKLSHALSTKEKKVAVSPRTVYANPTIESLAAALIGSESSGAGQPQATREQRMDDMVKKYTHDLPDVASLGRPVPAPQHHTVVLTGSTGSLGNYVLQELIASPKVATIYCLNRSVGAETRQQQSFSERGVEADFSKVNFLHSDFGKDRFGLDSETYGEMLETATIFIHNAWAVDFNLALESYEPVHISGTRRCIDFSTQSKYRAHITFISSVASVGNWSAIHSDKHEVPEHMIAEHSLPLPQGYGESKHVASLVLAAAAERSGVPCTIARAGQLAGPSAGDSTWNKHEWLPSIIISSKAMGAVPGDLGNQNVVDWVPMDLAAKTVWDVASSHVPADGDLLRVAHVVNPQTASWSDLVPAICASLQEQTSGNIRNVSFKEWLDLLTKNGATPQEMDLKPALKLAEFYQGLLSKEGGLPRLATAETSKISRTMEEMKPVDSDMMTRWMKSWWA